MNKYGKMAELAEKHLRCEYKNLEVDIIELSVGPNGIYTAPDGSKIEIQFDNEIDKAKVIIIELGD